MKKYFFAVFPLLFGSFMLWVGWQVHLYETGNGVKYFFWFLSGLMFGISAIELRAIRRGER